MHGHAYQGECRHFPTYTGIKLPLKLLTPLEDADIANRNTYFRAYYDDQNRMVVCQKMVYGEIELEHRYEYYPSGALRRVEIIETDDEPKIMCFDEHGA
jgi:Family of unknown function (DUF6156)